MEFKYLQGLNPLRFFAAFFVIIAHANLSLVKIGLCKPVDYAFFNRGNDAVDFFFTLSGFLITYLLIIEIKNTGTVSIKNFYLRRVFRIWPLYFLIVILGFLILGFLFPAIYQQEYFTFPIGEGLLMFIFFLPNYAAKNYAVGFLNPLWSIGVEEQFYLFWAPLVKFFKSRILPMIIVFIISSTFFYMAVASDFWNIPHHLKVFFLTQKFYAMAIGSVFAYILYHYYELYDSSFLTGKFFQWMVILVISWHYLVGFPFSESLLFKWILAFLYGLLILNVSVISNKAVNLEKPWLVYLGLISYGLYMYHMLNDYALRLVTQKLMQLKVPDFILIPAYYIALIGITIIVAGLSYKYFEKYFLKLKNRLHN